MTISQMLEAKEKYNFSYERIAKQAGLPKGTVQKILTGVTKLPRRDTYLTLDKAIKKLIDDNEMYRFDFEEPKSCFLSDNLSYYGMKRQGEYTLEDYKKLPDDKRYELIEGNLFVMEAPSTLHQIILVQLSMQIENFIDSNDGTCLVFVAPCDVQLDKDDKTILEPDVFVVCDKGKIKANVVYGAPDFVVEVLSKSTKSKDMEIKLRKYREAGVREYWIIDPDRRKIIVYQFCFDEEYTVDDIDLYDFSQKVPVGIYDGKLKIDFTKIARKMDVIME